MLLRILIKAQFSPLERFLAKRQYKTFVLDASKDGDSESGGSDSEYEEMNSQMKNDDSASSQYLFY